MSTLTFTHSGGVEHYGDPEPMYEEIWLDGQDPFAGPCLDLDRIEHRVSPPQFDATGHLITKPRDDAARVKLMATIDRILGVEHPTEYLDAMSVTPEKAELV